MISNKEEIIKFLKILADSTRLDILDFLRDGPKNSSEIETRLEKAQSTVSHQLKTLKDAELITSDAQKDEESNKSVKYYIVKNKSIFQLLENIESFVMNKDLFDILL